MSRKLVSKRPLRNFSFPITWLPLATNTADTNGFVAGIATLLKDDGVAVIECPYVKDLIEHGEFDTIYHEHLCYFSLTSLIHLFARHDLLVHDVKRIVMHGGSLRLFVGKKGQ